MHTYGYACSCVRSAALVPAAAPLGVARDGTESCGRQLYSDPDSASETSSCVSRTPQAHASGSASSECCAYGTRIDAPRGTGVRILSTQTPSRRMWNRAFAHLRHAAFASEIGPHNTPRSVRESVSGSTESSSTTPPATSSPFLSARDALKSSPSTLLSYTVDGGAANNGDKTGARRHDARAVARAWRQREARGRGARARCEGEARGRGRRGARVRREGEARGRGARARREGEARGRGRRGAMVRRAGEARGRGARARREGEARG